MPNIVAHYICGNLVVEKLCLKKQRDFLKGNLYPDYVDKEKHYRTPGKKFEIPDIDKFQVEEQIENDLFKLGFLTHLILDKLFLEEYVIDKIYSKITEDIDIFEPNRIYQDYTNISNRLLAKYNLTLDGIDDLMLEEKEHIDFKKYKDNTDVIRTSTNEKLRYLDLEDFTKFLDTSATQITNYIKRKKYK